ncbi:MAG: yfhM2 [Acidobacteria bacterium]|nr:yfhM2 [Acidobacteriota bacterium]
MKNLVVGLFLAFAALTASAAKLTIIKAGPVGEIDSLAEANEIRVVFSEPMVAVGKVPKNLTVPWFHIAPQVTGAFRWSGTTTLIFTPDPKTPLPFATKFDVTVDAGVKSIAGNLLDKPYSFSFTTPTVKLLSTDFYRRGGKAGGSVLIELTFNQPVDAGAIVQHLQLRTKGHEFKAPVMPPEAVERLKKIEPAALAAFDAKVAKAQAAATSDGAPVLSFVATDWNQARWPPRPERVVLETKPGIPSDTWINVLIDGDLAQKPANVRTGKAQAYTIELPPAFFVENIDCRAECNPEYRDPIIFRTQNGVSYEKLKKAVTVVDVTDPAKEVVLEPEQRAREYSPVSETYSIDDLGYSVQPAHTYAIRIDPALAAEDGQALGYAWMAVVEYWHKTSFISFGGGHGVWESGGGPNLPFYARNVKGVKQWLAPVTIERLMPSILELDKSHYAQPPSATSQDRKLAPVADKIQSYGVNVTPAVGAGNHGLVWAAIHPGESIARSKPAYEEQNTVATLVQVTNLGISVKDSPLNTLVLVTRLDDAAPVAGAKVSIRTIDNKVFWSGTTDASGLAMAPNTDLRVDRTKVKKSDEGTEEYDGDWEALDVLHFIVTAEKDGDIAYVGSDWHDGIASWDLGVDYSLFESAPLLRGKVFTDRGVYKPGEEVHVKAVLRSDAPTGMKLLAPGTKVEFVIRDSHDKEVDKRSVAVNDWSSNEFVFKVPDDGALGTYQIMADVEGQRLRAFGDFLVAAYRRPDFRVDVTLAGKSSLAGTNLDGKIVGRYLFGGAMSSRPVAWKYTKLATYDVPPKVADRWPEERYSFLEAPNEPPSRIEVSSKEQKLNAKGELTLSLPTELAAGIPFSYQLEGEVTDVSRQKIAGRASFRVDPAPWYIGVRTPPYFAESAKGLDTEFVAASIGDGTAVAGVKVVATLQQIQWNSVRQAEGNGFYNWQTERKDVPAGEWTVTTTAGPAPLHIPLPNGGEYELTATATDSEGRTTHTKVAFYAVGGGYTAWERYDHNRIDLVPEKKTYRPGETARIMIKSPWERATALLTTEREGVRTSKEFALTSTQQTISVPITEKDIPNIFVSVLLVKGRTKEGIEDSADPGKPSFRLGYTELKVEDAAKRLAVTVKANREEFRPATKAKIDVEVKDAKGKPVQSEVTLWAVDYGVLSLTAYRTPDILDSIYLRKSLQVANEDSRERIISRRVLTPKGATDGGGGGRDAGPGMIRKDFRVLAFWVGSIVTDAKGHAKTEITLPESLTTYRIMAVAGDRQSRFGWGQAEIRINKPLLLTQAFPRFLAVGDKALFGAVVHSQLKQAGTATVTIKTLDPNVLELTGETTAKVDVPAGGAVEARFIAAAKAVGDARVQMSVSMNGESDAFEDVIPVRILISPEVFAAYGSVTGASPATAKEQLDVPDGVVPGYGGLHLDLSSTAMVGLGEGARYLVDYPYGCAEQRSSAALALMLTSDLGSAFKLPGIDAPKARATAQTTLNELTKFQCGDGGFSFWPGDCWSESPYLTSYVLHVYQRGQKLGYTVDKPMLDRAYVYLEGKLGAEKRPTNEGWWPAYTAWQAFATKVLVEGGRNEDSHITRLISFSDRMPLFAIAYLADALIAKGEKGPRLEELHRRMSNAILPEGGSAHVEELNDPYLLWFWNSNVRSTAIVMGTLVRNGSDEEIVRRMVRWLMAVRKGGRWGSTQENAWAMESLVDYYRKYESETPDFTAIVTLGSETLARDPFRGRSTEAKAHDVPMLKLQEKAGQSLPVVFTREGAGTLFYSMRLRYARNVLLHDPLDQGFAVTRRYDTNKTSFKAGDLIKVTLTIRNTKERRFVAVTDPIPAGTEPVESWFATTSSDLAEEQRKQEQPSGWMWWQRGGFDHVERHDDRVDLFATRLGEGPHEFTYMLRATTAGTFVTAPTHAEEMYEPEVFGRTASAVVEVK